MNAPIARTDTLDLIGNTPLVLLEGPSEAAGCEIWGKCEFANPGASVKDRAALWIVRDAERKGTLRPGEQGENGGARDEADQRECPGPGFICGKSNPSKDRVAGKGQHREGGQRVVHGAQHLHGGIGMDIDYPVHRTFRWAKHLELSLGGGTVQLLRLGEMLATT